MAPGEVSDGKSVEIRNDYDIRAPDLSENDTKGSHENAVEKGANPDDMQERDSDTGDSGSIREVFDVYAIDPVLARKMALANKAIDEIGMTGFQWKMFYLNGFGYAVDSVSSRQTFFLI